MPRWCCRSERPSTRCTARRDLPLECVRCDPSAHLEHVGQAANHPHHLWVGFIHGAIENVAHVNQSVLQRYPHARLIGVRLGHIEGLGEERLEPLASLERTLMPVSIIAPGLTRKTSSSSVQLASEARATSVRTSARAMGILPVHRSETVAARRPNPRAAVVRFGTRRLSATLQIWAHRGVTPDGESIRKSLIAVVELLRYVRPVTTARYYDEG
jgi:hypothetical protein